MNRKIVANVGVLALALSSSAYAVLDACDAFGPLTSSGLLEGADRLYSGAAANDYFGKSVAVGDFDGDGDADIVIGAPGNDLAFSNSGAAYVFFGPISAGTRLSASTANAVFTGEGTNAQAGWSVANAGDVNADGRDDILIGSYGGAATVHPGGAAHLKLGGTLTGVIPLGTQATAEFTGVATGDQFGATLSGAGDVNGDGYDDILIGANQQEVGPLVNAGAAYVWYGPVTGLKAASSANAAFASAVASAAFGTGVGRIGDVNGDGFDDIGVGSPALTVAGVGTNAGSAFIFYGGTGGTALPATTVSTSADVIYTGTVYSRGGFSLSGAGDQNADGRGDFWVGAKQGGASKQGASYLIYGSNTASGTYPLETAAYARVVGYDSNDLAGTSIVGNIDLDANGVNDVVIGAERGDGAATQSGAAFTLHGPFTGNIALKPLVLAGTAGKIGGRQYLDYAGAATASGDVNNDGFDDALVGAWQGAATTGGATRQGLVSVYFGGRDTQDQRTYYADSDSDTYGSAGITQVSCTAVAGYVTNNTDCNDASSSYYPGAPESCVGGIDTNCDGLTGGADSDGDGYSACTECNDANALINPGAAELCGDSLDNNCNGLVDDSTATDAIPWCPDADGDTYGATASCVTACTDPGTFLVSVVHVSGDCNDATSTISPGAAEFCDAIDNNCDGVTDEATAVDASTWFADADGDSYGTYWSSVKGCTAPGGYVTNESDCDDASGAIRPGAAEVCDFADNDCDGVRYLGGPVLASRDRATSTGTALDDKLGSSVLLLEDQNADSRAELVSGAPFTDLPGLIDTGVVYVNNGSAVGGSTPYGTLLATGEGQWTTRLRGVRANQQFGSSLASGDINGDGTADLIVGAVATPAPGLTAGAVYIFFGPLPSGDVDATDASLTLKGEAAGDLFGSAVASGDIDNDGFDDLLLTSTNYGSTDVGRAYVVYGSAAVAGELFINAVPGVATFTGAASSDKLGSGAALADLDNDGFDDVIIGGGFIGSNDAGAAAIAYGSATRYSGASTATALVSGGASTERAGLTVANAGDVDNDGFEDLLVGSNNQRASLIFGSSTRLSTSTLATSASIIFQGAALSNSGQVVAKAGDVDGDGYDDFLVSATKDNTTASNAGAAYLVYGNTQAYFNGLATAKVIDLTKTDSFGRVTAGTTFPTYSGSNYGGVEGAKIVGLAASDNLGGALAGGLDFDGDGASDFVVGSQNADNGATANTGSAYVFVGGPYGTDDDASLATQSTYYHDSDADGYANDAGTQYTVCAMHSPISFEVPATPTPRGILVSSAPALDDCNDSAKLVHPGANENNGDNVDSDCDGFDNGNHEPYVYPTLAPTNVYTASTVTASPNGSDPDGDVLTYRYVWFVGGVEVVGQTGATLSGNFFAKGQTIEVEVYANDGRQEWGPYTNSKTVLNTLPTLTACQATPASIDRFTVLSSIAVGLNDDDPEDTAGLNVVYGWQKRIGPLWYFIPNEVGTSLASCNDRYVPGGTYNCDRGTQLRATCTPNDGVADGTLYVSSTVVVTNAAPTITTCSLSPAAPDTTQDITVTATGQDLDAADTFSISYEWLKNGVVDPGVTGTTWPANAQEHFDVIQVRCTATDNLGLSGDTVSATPVSVVNLAPSAPEVDLTPDLPRSDEGLSIAVTTAATDTDNDLLTYDYYWTKNGSVYANPTNPTSNTTLGASATTRDDVWEVTVVSNDGYVQGGSDSDFVTIGNTLPTVATAVLNPTTPNTSNTVQVFGTAWYDDDADAEDYDVVWYVNGSAVGAQSPDPMVLASTEIVRGDTVYATLTPKDAYGTGTMVTSSTITVVNKVPSSPDIAITPNPPGEDDTLSCNIVTPSTDDDGDTVTYAYAWYRNGSLVGGETASTFPASGTTYADVFYCTVVPSDGFGTGDLATSATIAIQDLNAPPAPTVDSVVRYSNVTSQTLTGTCQSGSLDCNTMVLTCNDGVASDTYYPSCTANAWSQIVATDRGLTTSCSAICQDNTLNSSLASNTTTTESCNPYDSYETSGAYGDVGATPVAEWSTLADTNAANILIVGNILAEFSDSQDWYRIDTSDNAVADASAGANNYKFEVVTDVGSADYDTWVYKNDPAGTAFCVGTGPYDDFSEDVSDRGDALNHTQPGNLNACAAAGSALYNVCESFAGSYYVKVVRASGTNCQNYQLHAYNGRP